MHALFYWKFVDLLNLKIIASIHIIGRWTRNMWNVISMITFDGHVKNFVKEE